MPYIVKEQRDKINREIEALVVAIESLGKENRAGVLNYTFSSIIDALYELRYVEINEAVGVLECVKQEYYRRLVAPYEDTKIEQNGDVFSK